jgi:hypothetical protein
VGPPERAWTDTEFEEAFGEFAVLVREAYGDDLTDWPREDVLFKGLVGYLDPEPAAVRWELFGGMPGYGAAGIGWYAADVGRARGQLGRHLMRLERGFSRLREQSRASNTG